MKKVLICSAAVLAILLAGSTALTKEKGKAKNPDRGTRKLSEEEKQWREKLKEMTPEQRRLEMAKKALANELGPWQEVRRIAVEEKAAKTVAAIDKIIAAKQEQFKKKLQAMKEGGPAKTDKAKGEGKRRDGPRPERKKAKTQE